MIKKLIGRAKHLANKASTAWYYNYHRLKTVCPVKMPIHESRTISVAIPHYNRSQMAHVALFNILNDPRIAEIVFLDDGSEVEEFNRLKAKLKPFSQKVKLFRRDVNWGPFANKIQAVELCSSSWIVLLDCDNTLLPGYLEKIFNLSEWKESTIYCPGYAYPKFDFRESLGGEDIDFNMSSAMVNSGEFKASFFNDGNYFLHRDSYIKHLKPFWNYSAIADVIFANYLWLSFNNTLKVLRDSKYIHRIHGGSIWLNTLDESIHIVSKVKKRFRDNLRPDSECMNYDFSKTPYEWVEPTSISLNEN